MYVINEYELKVVEEYLEQISYSLSLFIKDQSGIAWFEEEKEERTLIIMPRLVEEIMREEVFSQDIPFIFSSATLSEEQSFNYIAKSLGVDDFLSFTVESPFDYENNMTALAPFFETGDHQQKMDYMIAQLNKMQGGSFTSFSKKRSYRCLKTMQKENLPTRFILKEKQKLVRSFQNSKMKSSPFLRQCIYGKVWIFLVYRLKMSLSIHCLFHLMTQYSNQKRTNKQGF